MTLEQFALLYHRELHARADTGGVFKGAHEAALQAVVNAAYEHAAQACEAFLTGHRNDGPDAARRALIIAIRSLKQEVPLPPEGTFGFVHPKN